MITNGKIELFDDIGFFCMQKIYNILAKNAVVYAIIKYHIIKRGAL